MSMICRFSSTNLVKVNLSSAAEECAQLASVEKFIFEAKLKVNLKERFGMELPDFPKYQRPSLIGKDIHLKADEVREKLRKTMHKFMVLCQRVVDERNAKKAKEGPGAADGGDG